MHRFNNVVRQQEQQLLEAQHQRELREEERRKKQLPNARKDATVWHLAKAMKLLREADSMQPNDLLENAQQNKLIDSLQHLLLALHTGEGLVDRGEFRFDFERSFLFGGTKRSNHRHALVIISDIIIRLAKSQLSDLAMQQSAKEKQDTTLGALYLARLAYDLLFSGFCRHSLTHFLYFSTMVREKENYSRWKECYINTLDLLLRISAVAFNSWSFAVETQKVLTLWTQGADALILWESDESVPDDLDSKDLKDLRTKLQHGEEAARSEQDNFPKTLFDKPARSQTSGQQSFFEAVNAFEEDLQTLDSSSLQSEYQRVDAARALCIRFRNQIQFGLAQDITRLDKYQQLQGKLHTILARGACAGQYLEEFWKLARKSHLDKHAHLLHYAYTSNDKEVDQQIAYLVNDVISLRCKSYLDKEHMRDCLTKLRQKEIEPHQDFFDYMILGDDDAFSYLKDSGDNTKMNNKIIRKLDPLFALKHLDDAEEDVDMNASTPPESEHPIEISDDEIDNDKEQETIQSSVVKRRRLKRNISSEVREEEAEEVDGEVIPSAPRSALSDSSSLVSTQPICKKRRIIDSDDEE